MKGQREPQLAPDPLAEAERLSRKFQSFRLVTEGRDPSIDALGICCAALAALSPDDQQGVVAFLASRYAGPQ
jgi:hypothetical protein